MLCLVWSGRPAAGIAACALLALSACAPNSVRTPLESPVTAEAEAEGEQGRYGTLLRMASSTRENGDPAAAIQLYRQAITAEQERPEAYVLMGEALIELEAYQEAVRTFEEAIRKDANSAAAHRGYGRAMVALHRPEVAIGHYETATRLAPRDIQAWNGLGVAYDLAGEHAMAEATYRRGLEIAPDSMLLRNNLGLSLALDGRHDESIALLSSVMEEPGARARNRQNLALAYGLKGDLAAAERIGRIDLGNDEVENNLAYYASIRAVDDRRVRATAVGVQAPDRGDARDNEVANRKLAAVAMAGGGFELGSGPTGRWFLNLGEHMAAAEVWRGLKNRHEDLLGEYTRLASTRSGTQPLLIGPISDAAEAQDLCASLKTRGESCSAIAL
jgi:Flp pilus assembly protein TadD